MLYNLIPTVQVTGYVSIASKPVWKLQFTSLHTASFWSTLDTSCTDSHQKERCLLPLKGGISSSWIPCYSAFTEGWKRQALTDRNSLTCDLTLVFFPLLFVRRLRLFSCAPEFFFPAADFFWVLFLPPAFFRLPDGTKTNDLAKCWHCILHCTPLPVPPRHTKQLKETYSMSPTAQQEKWHP